MAIKDLRDITRHLLLCNGGSCKLLGAEQSTAALREEIVNKDLGQKIHTTKTMCNGRCKDGPIVISLPDGIWFRKMTSDKAQDFVTGYLVQNRIPTQDVLYRYGDDMIYNTD